MEKINISDTDFEKFVDKFYEAFMKYPYPDCKESSEFALKTLVFNVKKFNENDWNDCDVEVPSEFIRKDLLIRWKDISKDEHGTTMCRSAYKVGYFSDSSNSFVYHDGNLLVDLDDPDEYEYKLIK